ncbi:D-stereospecific aminopeptidase [Malassezia japonica]|uniref:D-stereospecific aminopeptidase n=1 Tax=Malassezia japonica TaxID=223818 RepID=A0AAF0EUH3_9BASI|nr:D-stereospecific aminopeptidase [Malassezia japonica]WFD37368.1 D-stereospecific aminopeptidase [Malassezia japonica]
MHNVGAHATVGPSASSEIHTPWRKLLWRRQPYPDNYVDASFLSQLRTNATAAFPSYATIALSSLGIVQQLSSVLLFVALFVHLHLGTLSAQALVAGSLGVTLVLGCISLKAHPLSKDQPSLLRSLPSLAVLALTLHALSPVLRTLSEATTSDSIWAFSAMLFGCHWALADYSMQPTTRPLLSSTLSLNLAMCASVVLSSRLSSDVDVFALLLAALQLFAIYPLLRQRIYLAFGAMQHSGAAIPRAAVPCTMVLVAASLYAMLPLSRVVAVVLMPGSLRWKHEMRGPWDEAVLAPAVDGLVGDASSPFDGAQPPLAQRM